MVAQLSQAEQNTSWTGEFSLPLALALRIVSSHDNSIISNSAHLELSIRVGFALDDDDEGHQVD